MSVSITYNTLKVSNAEVFYRESGTKSNPTLLLLHGFPSSSRQFKQIIPLLNDKFHIIAPDLPGFGLTKIDQHYKVSFAAIAETVEQLLDALKISKFSVYVFDYGAPTGFRLGLNSKYEISSIITQNGNAYEEGLTSFWDPLKVIWEIEDKEGAITVEEQKTLTDTKEALKPFFLNVEPYNMQYFDGEPDKSVVDPEDPIIDWKLLVEYPNTVNNQLGLFADYRNNVKLYPQFQQYFAATNVPILAVWGVNDSFFGEKGQKAYKNHSNNVKVVDIDGGHFTGVTHAAEVAEEIIKFTQEYKII